MRYASCIAVVLAASFVWAQDERPKSVKIDFAHDIAPIIKARCGECHTNGKYKGSLSLDTRQDVLKAKIVVPGKSGASELFKRITSADKESVMPPKGERLSAKEIALLKAWIDGGLAWESGFTFKVSTYVAALKPRRPTLPAARPGLGHPVDRILSVYFAANNIVPPPPADDVAFIRRIHQDVLGQTPAIEEVDAFVSDPAVDKRSRLARRVLSEKRAYADHWLTFWNDLLRNDYAGTGYIDGGRKQISAWLYNALVQNKPYDRFVRELIDPSAEAEGFILGIKWRGNVNASQVRELQFSQNISLVFLGANMKCASCHDSFIDSWKLDDAYSLAAVIAEKPLEIHRCDVATGQFASPRFLWPELGKINPKASKPERLQQLAQLVTHPDNGRFTRTIVNRLWHRLMGRGLVQPIDIMANRPWSEDLLDYLATYLADNGYDLKKLIEHIVTSQAYQAQAAIADEETPAEQYVFRGPELKRMNAEQFVDAVWQLTGTAPAKPAAPVAAAPFDDSCPKERRFVRTALMKSDLLLRSLGRPNREQVVTQRGDVLTTLQALDLSNGQILNDYLARGAANLLKAYPQTSADQFTEIIYRRALSRRPTAAELATARAIIGQPISSGNLADLLWCVVMLPEFQLVR